MNYKLEEKIIAASNKVKAMTLNFAFREGATWAVEYTNVCELQEENKALKENNKQLVDALKGTKKLNLHIYEPNTIGNMVYLKIKKVLESNII